MLRRFCSRLFLVLAFAAAPAAAQTPPPAERGVCDPGPLQADRKVLRDAAGAVVALGRDFWCALSAPVRMDGRDWLITGGVVAIGGLLYTVDDDITRMVLRNADAPVMDEVIDTGTFLEPVGLMGNTNFWFATGALATYAAGWERPHRMFVELLYSHWIAGAIRGGVNRVVGRSRPHDERGARHFALGGGTSFPSGHASTIFQVAAVLAHHADSTPASIALYGLAGTVAVQRISSEQHWASDVWLGAAYGWAVARLVIRLHEGDGTRLEPAVSPSGDPAVLLRITF